MCCIFETAVLKMLMLDLPQAAHASPLQLLHPRGGA